MGCSRSLIESIRVIKVDIVGRSRIYRPFVSTFVNTDFELERPTSMLGSGWSWSSRLDGSSSKRRVNDRNERWF